MKIELDKAYSDSVVNLIVQILMTEIPVVRPIAFSAGSGSNVIATDDSVVEDMTEFISNVCREHYIGKTEDLVVFSDTVSGVLNTDAFARCGIMCPGTSDVLHVLSPAFVQVVFRRAAGGFTEDENTDFLNAHGINTDSLTVIPSNHCDIQDVVYNPWYKDGKKYYNLDFKTHSKIPDAEVLEIVRNVMSGISGSIG